MQSCSFVVTRLQNVMVRSASVARLIVGDVEVFVASIFTDASRYAL